MPLFGHGVKCFLHTVVTEVHIARHLYHGAGFALRTAADVTDLLVFVFRGVGWGLGCVFLFQGLGLLFFFV